MLRSITNFIQKALSFKKKNYLWWVKFTLKNSNKNLQGLYLYLNPVNPNGT